MIPYVDDIYKQIDEQSNIQLFVEIELSLMRSSEHRMDLNNLYDESVIKLNAPQKQKSSWFEWFRLRRRKPNSEEEINEVHDLIVNVYESIDDQARAVLLSLSKIIQDENESILIEEKIKAILAIGHSLCSAHTQVKYSTQLYSKLLLRALSHDDFRMRLAAIIAIGETAIDNLSFQIKLNEMNIIPKLFEMMRTSIQYADYSMDEINEHTKLIAWTCFTIVNSCANCLPNILLLKDIVPNELDVLKEAVRLEIWSSVWHRNYAQVIVQFADRELTTNILSNAVQPQLDFLDHLNDQTEASPNTTSSVPHLNTPDQTTSSTHYKRCTIL